MTYQIPQIEGFIDSTSGNDCCPSIYYEINKDCGLQLFCDHLEQELSEFADLEPSEYFAYTLVLQDQQFTLLRSNDVEEVKSFIEKILKSNFLRSNHK